MDASFYFDPQNIATWAEGAWSKSPQDPIIGFHYDSRLLKKGDIFVALKTEKNDGHLFLKQAFLEREAVGAIVENIDPSLPFPQLRVHNTFKAFQNIAKKHRSTFKKPLIGITGSCGKTSTKDLLSLLLGSNLVLKTESNLNNTLGVPFNLLKIRPDIHQYAVLEAGINLPGEMATLSDLLRPDCAIITNILPQHLEGLGSLEGIAHEKSFLCKNINNNGFFLCNESVAQFSHFDPPPNIQRILVTHKQGILPKANDTIVLYNTQKTPQGLTLNLGYKSHNLTFTLPNMSQGMANNAALALVLCLELGLSQKQLQERLSAWTPSFNRGTWHTKKDKIYYLDSYNSGPASLKDSLEFFQNSTAEHLARLYIIGPMNELGKDCTTFHYNVAKQLCMRPMDTAILINNKTNPIRQGLLDLNIDPAKIHSVHTPEDAKPFLEAFSGYIFIKASHAYGLECLLEP